MTHLEMTSKNGYYFTISIIVLVLWFFSFGVLEPSSPKRRLWDANFRQPQRGGGLVTETAARLSPVGLRVAMSRDMLTTEEDLRRAEIHSREDAWMWQLLEDGDISPGRVDDLDYCQSMAKRLKWPNGERLRDSCRRVTARKEGLRVIERDGELPLAHELAPIQIKVWQTQAASIAQAAEKYGVYAVRATDILRRYHAELDA